MKALSISPDFALDILAGEKKIEYRSWETKYRGDLLICSTCKKISGTIPGHALIVCSIADIKKFSDRKFAWILDNFRDIKPFSVKGQQGLFEVDDQLIEFTGDMSEAEADKFVEQYFNPLFV